MTPHELRCNNLKLSIKYYLSKLIQINTQSPRFYLQDYIQNLKQEINDCVDNLLCQNLDLTECDFKMIKNNQELMIQSLELFENECLANLDLTKFSMNCITELKNISDFNSNSLLYNMTVLEHKIVEEITNYKRRLFMDKWLFFKKTSQNNTSYRDFGKLIIKNGIVNEKMSDIILKQYKFYEDLFTGFQGTINDKNDVLKWCLFDQNIEIANQDLIMNSPIVQINFQDSYKTREISLNRIKMISPFMFYGLENLEILDLSKSKIIAISKLGFIGLKNLKHLNLSWNRLDKLESNYFTDLPKLESLVLSENQINLIEKDAFSGLKNLKILCLDNNRIKMLEDDALKDLISLEKLNLESNKIKCLNNIDFSMQSSLVFLNVNYNEIEFIKIRLFENLNNLKELHLKKNNLKFLEYETFKGLDNLEVLDLSENFIDSFDKDTFTELRSLRTLFLNHNSASINDDKLYDDLDQLEDLYL